ncbi:hypothetical protein FACS1894193_10850 [Bacilli bacterium]|nr:hypothetical protein FACS1894193_10850 [Bacilli bacterium]
MKLTKRQKEIIAIVKQRQPISGEKIAQAFGLSRATLRSDFSILTMLGLLEARPKIGYLYSGKLVDSLWYKELYHQTISDIILPPLIVAQDLPVHEAITMMFLHDIGAIYVGDENKHLLGVISRKDLLRVSITHANLNDIPVAMIMTRAANVISINPNARIIDAGFLLDEHKVDSLPVLSDEQQIIGKVTKTTLMSYFIRHGLDMEREEIN